MRHGNPLSKFRHSRFRRSFHLTPVDKHKAKDIGLADLKDQITDIIISKLDDPYDDGHQTPKIGHPVFTAMHATATCCRKCLFRWHRIPTFRPLEEQEINFITDIIYRWIKNQLYK